MARRFLTFDLFTDSAGNHRDRLASRERAKKSHRSQVSVFPLTPDPSPHWGEGKVDIRFDSLAPCGGEGGRRPGEGERDTEQDTPFGLLVMS